MIVTCPKCGFTQPKDRYCANCGVDMSLFRKAEVPLWKRVVQNWIFQASVLVFALLAVFFGLRLQQKLSNHDADTQFTNARSAQVTATQLTPPPDEKRSAPTPSPVATLAAVAAPVATVAPAASAAPNAVASASASTVTQVGVVYADMPRGVFNDLVIDARGVNTEGPFTTGILMENETRIKAARGLVTLDSQAAQAVRINQPLAFFKGVRDPGSGSNLGLTAQVTPQASDEQGLHVLVDIQRVLRENGGPAPVEQTFQFEFVIPKGAAGFIGGLLPRRLLDETERALYRGSPVLNVMGTPDYVQAQSEFVIFFQAH